MYSASFKRSSSARRLAVRSVKGSGCDAELALDELLRLPVPIEIPLQAPALEARAAIREDGDRRQRSRRGRRVRRSLRRAARPPVRTGVAGAGFSGVAGLAGAGVCASGCFRGRRWSGVRWRSLRCRLRNRLHDDAPARRTAPGTLRRWRGGRVFPFRTAQGRDPQRKTGDSEQGAWPPATRRGWRRARLMASAA